MTTVPGSNAFPTFDSEGECARPGLTKREYFAALAMQGLVTTELSEIGSASMVATEAIRQADALIAALNGEGQANG